MIDLFGNSDLDEESFVVIKRRRIFEEFIFIYQFIVGGSVVLEQFISIDFIIRLGVRIEQQIVDIQQVCRGFRFLNKEIRILNNFKILLEEGLSCDIYIYI